MFRFISRTTAIFAATAAAVFGQSDSIFVPVTPCRVVDTRGANGTFGGPSMTTASTRSFPIPSGPCAVPSSASAYSLNITVVPKVPLGFLAIWPTGSAQPTVSTLNSPSGQIVANAAIVPAGTSGAVSIYVTDATDVIIDINGYFSVQTDSTTGSTKFGLAALAVDSGIGYNTAFGSNALTANTTGYGGTAMGAGSLQSNTTGGGNSAFGEAAMISNTTGGSNTAVGYGALEKNVIGSENTAIGEAALLYSTGSQNTALGQAALLYGTGSSNLVLGFEAGISVTTGSNNVILASQGEAADSGVIRIGSAPNQTSAYMAGITGIPVTGAAVIVSSSGQLGVQASSIKYKEDVHDLSESDDALMELRPVSFRYKGTAPVQFGLIAEEVEKVYPDLVARDANGQPMAVQYHELPALLLKRIQVQQKTIEQLENRLAELEAMVKK